jgi:hypothetical protein
MTQELRLCQPLLSGGLPLAQTPRSRPSYLRTRPRASTLRAGRLPQQPLLPNVLEYQRGIASRAPLDKPCLP